MSFLQPSDFVGIAEQSVNKHTEPTMQRYINKYEPIYLRKLLGNELYNDFVADLLPTPSVPTSVPQDAKFLAIFNKIHIDESTTCGHQRNSDGIKEMLRLFVMFHYARDNQYDFAITGATKNSFSNSEIAQLNQTNAIDNFNMAVESFQTIQWYICENPENYDYDKFNGKKQDYTTWL